MHGADTREVRGGATQDQVAETEAVVHERADRRNWSGARLAGDLDQRG
jgi:hypothetical protein